MFSPKSEVLIPQIACNKTDDLSNVKVVVIDDRPSDSVDFKDNSELNEKPAPVQQNPSESTQDWRCIFCDQDLSTPTRLSLHIKMEHKDALVIKNELLGDKQNKVYVCKLCGMSSKTWHYLVRHTLKRHGHEITVGTNDAVKDPRRCGICGKLCSGKQGLRNHLYATHGRQMQISDKEALRKFVESQLSSSVSIGQKIDVDEEECNDKKRQRNCDLDIEEFPRKRVKSRSAKKLSADNQVIHCSECGLSFVDSVMVERHYDLRHTNVQCPICSVWCKGRIGLENHDDVYHFGAVRFQLNNFETQK